MALTRRGVLLAGIAAGGGLAVAYGWRRLDDGEARAKFAAGSPEAAVLNAWLKIRPDGEVICGVPRAEMGQGVTTSLPMLLAEELDADWRRVRFQFTPLDKDYFNFGILLRGRPLGETDGRFWAGLGTGVIREVFHQVGLSVTISSTSVVDGWDTLREAGAAARHMLVAEAAARWGVPPEGLTTAESRVRDPATGRTLAYGALAAAAARRPAPSRPPLKDPGAFRLIGRSLPRLDVPAKVTGTARFALDTAMPDMLYGAVRHAPAAGGSVGELDDRAALRVPGVAQVVRLGDQAVAVLARNTWAALKGAEALVVGPPARGPDSTPLMAAYRAALDQPGASVFRDDEGLSATLAAGPVLEAAYQLPFLAHACMEPMNCTARLEGGVLTLWAPTQAPTVARDEVAKALGLPPEAVDLRQTLLGGGFGRRAEVDFVVQAARAAAAVPGRPVKLTWSRTEDLRHDMYRPAAVGRVRGVLGADGQIAAMDYALASESVVASNYRRAPTARGGNAAKDRSALSGALGMRYQVPVQRMAYVPRDDGIPTGFWRSVSGTINPFLIECFMDEAAEAAGADPLDFRLRHLAGLDAEQAVLRAAARLGEWGAPLATGPGLRRGRGLAFVESNDSLVAQVIQVAVAADGVLRVERVACVVDCRTVVHPDGVVDQITGGILDGLNAALQGLITFRQGMVEQSNFHDYPWLRLAQVPEVVVELLPQGGRPGGAGEPGVPAVAPALANAIFAATGQRMRSLPIGWRIPG